jgi:VWFA-related protein
VRRLCLLALLCVCVVGARPAGQAAPKPGTPAAPDSKPIFRLTVSLVQLDAVVTDRHGRHVTTLGPDDFEVYQDGHPQPVIAATYVDMGSQWEDTSGLPPLQVEAVRPRDARRVMAIVVDDLRMSLESVYYAKRGLQKFAEREFQPGDLAMLVTTSGGRRNPPALTFSPLVLKAAINRLEYSLWGVRAESALDSITGTSGFDSYRNFQERNFAASALERVEAVIELLRGLPGRKSVTLVSEGFSVFGFGMDNAYVRDVMQTLVDRANRAGVVVYALDPRGLVYTGPTAADSLGRMKPGEITDIRNDALRESQDGLRYLAGQTGGFAVVNSNDLAGGMRKIVTDQEGYYLVGYQPEAGTLAQDAAGRFRHVKIKVKRKGLRVRTRSGFYAVASE